MKNLLLIFIFSNLILACRNSAVPGKPEILTAEYKIITNDEFERGYRVFLEFKTDKGLDVKVIVLKNRKFIFKEKGLKSDCCYLIDYYFPIESKLIQNFNPPKPDSRPDGIVFEINGKSYFYEIKFKLIN